MQSVALILGPRIGEARRRQETGVSVSIRFVSGITEEFLIDSVSDTMLGAGAKLISVSTIETLEFI